MVFQHEINSELWNAVRANYEAGNYSGAILDSILFLTDTIRNKSGLEGDGASLVGQAFGGENPRIKLNKLQTDSERDEQKGVQEILKGIYTGIRNPRSHDAIKDEESSADSIIGFINFLLGLVDNSQLSFNKEEFFKRITDQYYVKNKQYSDLLVQEIPKRQRANIAIEVVLKRDECDVYVAKSFLNSLYNALDEAEISRVYKVISDELRVATDFFDLRYLIACCKGEFWKYIDASVRLRTEEIIYKDFSNGTYYSENNKCGEYGALATWIDTNMLLAFNKISRWTNTAICKLTSNDEFSASYIDKCYWDNICSINRNGISWSLKNYFISGLKSGNQAIIEKLKNQIVYDDDHPWWKVFETELKDHPEIQHEELPF